MTLQNVIDNLNNTIAGKEELLNILLRETSSDICCQFIRMNLSELRAIRDDIIKVKKSQETS